MKLVKKAPNMIYRTSLTMTLCALVLLSMSASFLLSSILQTSFAQSSSNPEILLSQDQEGQIGNPLAQLDAARQQFLSAWNNTAFTSQFDVFIAEGSNSGYGIYREHLPANVFRPGETMVLYVEPVGFGRQPIADISSQDGGNIRPPRSLYLINMTADYITSDSTGSELQTLEDLPAASLISHRQNTEFPLTLTLSGEQPFPVGDYIITYVITDEVSGQSFQIEKRITIDDNAITGALPLPDINEDNSMQSPLPADQLEKRSQASET